jgi:micrococcal nuclease
MQGIIAGWRLRTLMLSAVVVGFVAWCPNGCCADGAGATLFGKVVGVHDGDTLTLLTDGRKPVKVRLEGIDAPEIGQAFGNSSKQALSELVFGKKVRIVVSTTDDYGRKIANVFAGDLWVNLVMVQTGMAWQYTHYNSDPRLRQAEARAKAERSGLWRENDPTPPWDFRHGKAGKPASR